MVGASMTTSVYIGTSYATSSTTVSSADTTDQFFVEAGGTLVVSGSGASVTGATVYAGGVIDLFSGTASNTSVSGGRMVISGGNTATNVTVANGGSVELVTAKAALAGSLTMGAGSNALVLDKILSNGNVASVTISGFAAGDAVEIAGAYSSDTLSYATSGANTSVTFTASGSPNHQTFVFSGGLTDDFDLLATANGIDVASGAGVSATAGVELLFGSNVTVSSGATLYVYSGGSDSVTLGAGNSTVTLAGSGNSVTAGTGKDTITGGQDTLSFGGSGSSATLNGTIAANITDLGSALRILIGSNTQTDTITGFGSTDKLGVIELLNGVGGYASAAAIVSALHSDGHGGSLLTLGTTGSIDFLGVAPSQLTAANFKVG